MSGRDRNERRFRITIGATLFTMFVVGICVHQFTKESSPEPETPVVVDAPVVDLESETTAEDLQEEIAKDIEKRRDETLKERLDEASSGALKDGAKKAGKSFLERFIWGEEGMKEEDK